MAMEPAVDGCIYACVSRGKAERWKSSEMCSRAHRLSMLRPNLGLVDNLLRDF